MYVDAWPEANSGAKDGTSSCQNTRQGPINLSHRQKASERAYIVTYPMRRISTGGPKLATPPSRTAETAPSLGISTPSSGTVVGSEQRTAAKQVRSASKYEPLGRPYAGRGVERRQMRAGAYRYDTGAPGCGGKLDRRDGARAADRRWQRRRWRRRFGPSRGILLQVV